MSKQLDVFRSPELEARLDAAYQAVLNHLSLRSGCSRTLWHGS
jgi:hypothetical protein